MKTQKKKLKKQLNIWKLQEYCLFLQKKSCTRQFESKLSLRSFAFSLQADKMHFYEIFKQA